MNCNNCFDAFLSNCPTGITVNAHLTPSTSYKWVITDKFNAVYSNTVTSDGDGAIIIDSADLPDGFFNAFAGEFKLQIQNPSTSAVVPMKLCKYYDCITAEVVGGTDVEDEIGFV